MGLSGDTEEFVVTDFILMRQLLLSPAREKSELNYMNLRDLAALRCGLPDRDGSFLMEQYHEASAAVAPVFLCLWLHRGPQTPGF